MRSVVNFRLFILFVLLFPFAGLAQFGINPSGFGNVEPELTFNPRSPEPGEEVEVEIQNLISSLRGSSIEWFVDGALQEGSSNQSDLTFTAADLGDSTTVTAVISQIDGSIKRIESSTEPQYFDIIIEPQTHTPDFYIGRALPSVGSQVNVTVLINGNINSDLVYNWRINGDLIQGSSGLGMYTTSFEMPLDTRVFLSLSISDLRGEQIAQKSVVVPNVTPSLYFYEVHPLYGVSQNSYDQVILTGDSATLLAAPYNVDKRVYNNPDIADWRINGQDVRTSGNPYEITLSRNFDGGTSQVSFQLQSISNLLQRAVGSTMVRY